MKHLIKTGFYKFYGIYIANDVAKPTPGKMRKEINRNNTKFSRKSSQWETLSLVRSQESEDGKWFLVIV